MADYEHDLRRFIETTFLAGAAQREPLATDESLLDRGVIDSTGVLQLVGFIEETYGITVDDDDFVPENLDSLARLVAFLERKCQVTPAARAATPVEGDPAAG